MSDDTFLTALTVRFDAHEERLRGVALRMMGSAAEAEEMLAVTRAGLGRDEDASVRAWLTALVGRTCVRGLQERGAAGRWRSHGATEDPEDEAVTDPHDDDGGAEAAPEVPAAARPAESGSPARGPVPEVGAGDDGAGPGAARAGAESVWLALLVVLESLGGEERLAYVLHDLFGLPARETARITGGSPAEVARLARRARDRVRGVGAVRTAEDPGRQRLVVDRFLTAARARDARALAAVLDPDVVAYSDRGPVHGAPAVAEGAAAFARFADVSRPALVDGAVGAVAFVGGRAVAALVFTFRQDRIATLAVTSGEERVRALDLAFPDW
ncbi:sigma factor-like helix-turn-helix DNA-binding protein [Streptomyces sp. NPDC048330]|uniref:sigma factor-like helix-turn-helix DNA-binding protein n=1 Tax=Streptomyces sp. NPDC048330 TaxID=3365533 RepID=UPI0037159584